MNTTTHTPGPWSYQDREAEGLDGNIWSERNEDIARVYCCDMESGLANAALIAAAPEMLEALRQCITRPTFDSDHSITTEIAAMRRLAAINAIVEAAIRKAEGVTK